MPPSPATPSSVFLLSPSSSSTSPSPSASSHVSAHSTPAVVYIALAVILSLLLVFVVVGVVLYHLNARRRVRRLAELEALEEAEWNENKPKLWEVSVGAGSAILQGKCRWEGIHPLGVEVSPELNQKAREDTKTESRRTSRMSFRSWKRSSRLTDERTLVPPSPPLHDGRVSVIISMPSKASSPASHPDENTITEIVREPGVQMWPQCEYAIGTMELMVPIPPEDHDLDEGKTVAGNDDHPPIDLDMIRDILP
ncbi:hypothetical protein AcV7_002548 [Taiwanofungus camphoratus]|nr:hypothetical protein AcV7_002548 [Antrodia cinnamomea]